MPRCAIFGVNGYIGTNLAHALVTRGWAVTGYDVQDRPCLPGIAYHGIDITRTEAWEDFDADVDAVFFLAGLSGTHQSFEQSQRFINVNVAGLTALCDHLRRTNPRCRIIFPSTRLVYRGADQPLREDAEKETRSIYAVSKLACEHLLQAYWKAFGLPYTVVRICLPYGAIVGDQRAYGTFTAFLKVASAGQSLRIYGDGNQRRTVIHMQDVVNQLIGLCSLEASIGEVFNLGGEHFSMAELAGAVARHYGVNVTHYDWPEADLSIESGSTMFDDAKLQAVMPYRRQMTLAKWIAALD